MRTVRGLGAALVLSAAVGLSGCAVMSPVQTQVSYQPADGVALNLGDIRINNLLVIAPAEGGPGTVSANIVNNTAQEVAVQFADQASGATARVAAPPGVATTVSTEGDTVQLASVSAAPGSNLTMTVTTTATGTAQVTVPVLATQEFLSTLQPTPMPTATATTGSTATTTSGS